jgi:hypothetical protein
MSIRYSGLLVLFTAFFALAFTSTASATTYYIAANGSDSNNGTSKSTPWAHVPGMQTCTNNCAGHTPSAGDSFIFKGGDTWGATNWQMYISKAGTSTSPIYYGVDQTWYSGSSWTRPIFDGGNTGNYPGGSAPWGGNLVMVGYTSYITIDNIEFKGFMSYTTFGRGEIEEYMSNHVLIENCWFHDWGLSNQSSFHVDDAHGGVIADNTGVNADGDLISHCVFSNSEYTGTGNQNGVAVRAYDVAYSVFHDVVTGVLGGTVHDSLFYNISYPSGNEDFTYTTSGDTPYHQNVIYLTQDDGSTRTDNRFFAYNNVIHDINVGSGGIFAPYCSTFYIFNNVIWNNWGAGTGDLNLDPYNGSNGCGSYYTWNNTLEVPSSSSAVPIRIVNRSITIGTVVADDTHFVTDGTNITGSGYVTTFTQDGNVSMTNSTASTDGYTSGETYAFSPTSGNSATVGKGTNLTSSWWFTGSTTNDTTYACTYNTTLANVSCPGRTSNVRPTTGAWDVGAYQFSSNTASAPQPPTSLTAAVH